MGNAHLAPVRQRRTSSTSGDVARVVFSTGPLFVRDAVEAMIRSRGWSRTTAQNCRTYLLGSRFRDYLEAAGVRDVDQLTVEVAEEFLTTYRELGAAPATLAKTRNYLRALGQWCAAHGRAGLQGMEHVPAPRVPVKHPEALRDHEVREVLQACDSPRDRMVVEILVATGLRVSELVALRVDDLRLSERPPFAVVTRTAHSARRTKSGEDRVVPLAGVAGKLERYLASDRVPSPHPEVFLSSRANAQGVHEPLTIWGVEAIMQRLEAKTGIHCNPHKFRHTFATRAVNDGLPIFHLQQALGHRSIEMVRRYYSANRKDMLRSFARQYGER